jgi:hypothetical protein
MFRAKSYSERKYLDDFHCWLAVSACTGRAATTPETSHATVSNLMGFFAPSGGAGDDSPNNHAIAIISLYRCRDMLFPGAVGNREKMSFLLKIRCKKQQKQRGVARLGRRI